MRPKLGDLLVEAGVLTPETLAQALEAQRRDRVKRRLGEVVVDLQLASEARLLEVLSSALRVPVVDLDRVRPTPDALALMSRDDAHRWLVVPLAVERTTTRRALAIVMADPSNLDVVDIMQFKLGMTVKPLLATTGQVRRAIAEAYGTAPVADPTPPPGDPRYDPDTTWVGRPPARRRDTSGPVELRIEGGPRDGTRVILPPQHTLVFGRAPEADVVIGDMFLSRRHFEITHAGSSIQLVDLGSSNGTVVNGAPVHAAELRPGDRIELGRTVVRVHVD